MKKLNKKGFTLVELLAVIVILGVLLLIAVPSVTKLIDNSRKNAFKSAVQLSIENVESVASMEKTANDSIAECYVDIDDIDLERGEFDSSTKGIIKVSTSGKGTAYILGKYYVNGGTVDSVSPSTTNPDSTKFANLTTIINSFANGLSKCNWY